MYISHILEKYLTAVYFLDQQRYTMEAMTTKEQI